MYLHFLQLWIKILESETIAKVVGQGKMPTSMKELVESWTFDMPNPNPLSSNYNVSPQFTKLVEVLQACETHDDTFRGIIIGGCKLCERSKLPLSA